jgi:UDP-2,4-diacetamido-2,4,6-trideoxy-beta-L-altropyranose hydrolase
VSDTLLIRADADGQTGTGHAMRCLALAEAWREKGGAVHWLAGPWLPALDRRLAAVNADLTRLQVLPGSSDDAKQTAELARDLHAAWTVIDGYHFDADFRSTVALHSRILFLDDLITPDLTTCSVVVNANPVTMDRYRHVPVETQLLCGPTNSLLRREFRQSGQQPQPSASLRVLITMGGADAPNATALVLAALNRVSAAELTIRVLVGAANPHRHALEAIAAASGHAIELIVDSPQPSEVMRWADLAIAAAGTTTWELACLGVPTLLLITAENQKAVAEPMAALGGAFYLGLAADQNETTLAEALQPWLTIAQARTALGERARTIVDGDGVRRILAAMQGAELDLQPATVDDAEMIWQWANDPVIRQSSFNADPIPWETHLAWYNARLADRDGEFWIAWRYGTAIGQVRFTCDGDTATISVSLAPSARGQGWGPALIGRASRRLLAIRPVRTLIALIRQDNEPSRKAFALAGYHLHRTTTVTDRPAWDMRLTTGDVPLMGDPT